ncbi:MAG: hypothetical protein MJ074_04575 [Oscillospiraceae bacterium]|nr:hypothetical protein [Oscillospiraceae bacterium]
MGTGVHGGFGDGTQGARDSHEEYLTNDLPKGSPIAIPSTASIKEEHKDGYDQVKYTWNHGEYSYTSRWHTRTPNAPADQGDTWVVQRDAPGKGYGKDAHPAKHEIMVGKGKWVSKQEWQAAIRARKNGTATQEQKELLDNGHWKDKR